MLGNIRVQAVDDQVAVDNRAVLPGAACQSGAGDEDGGAGDCIHSFADSPVVVQMALWEWETD